MPSFRSDWWRPTALSPRTEFFNNFLTPTLGARASQSGKKFRTVYNFAYSAELVNRWEVRKLLKSLEARGGIEPPNKGFADLCLTTWLPRHPG